MPILDECCSRVQCDNWSPVTFRAQFPDGSQATDVVFIHPLIRDYSKLRLTVYALFHEKTHKINEANRGEMLSLECISIVNHDNREIVQANDDNFQAALALCFESKGMLCILCVFNSYPSREDPF